MSFSYFITDPSFSFEETLKAIQKHSPTFVCYRNKNCFNEKEIIEFANFAKKYSKVFINIDSLKNKNLLKYFDGIHLTSSKLNLIKDFENKLIIASTHSIEEVKIAQKADFITFSPIFDSKGRKGLGTKILEEVFKYHKRIIALGGIISQKEIKEIKNSKALGFASIRYFYFNVSSI